MTVAMLRAVNNFLFRAALWLALAAPIAIVVAPAPALATISHVGTPGTGTTTCTVPAHNIGDLIVIYAYRSGSTTAPSLGAGYTSILTKSGTSASGRLAYKVATATNDASGTWTNASQITCVVYRSSSYATGGSLYIGGSASSSSTTTTVNFPALTLIHTDSTSWALGFAGTSVATASLSTHAPTGMTFITGSDVTATVEVTGFDTNGAISSWSSTNTTVSASGNSVSVTAELIENQPGAVVSNFVQHISSSYIPVGVTNEAGDNFVFNFDPSLAGNGYVVTVAFPHGATPVISDNKGDTWPTSGGAGTVTADNGVGNMALEAFVLPTATTGTSQITVSFGGSPQQPVKVWITQFYNVTATLSASANAAGVNSGGIVSPGSLTPGVSNCLVLSYMSEAVTSGTTNPALIVPETGYALNDADTSIRSGFLPNASEFALQTTAATTTPRFYLNAVGTDTYNAIALALTTGSHGTAKPSGAGAAPWIDRILYFSSVNSSSPTSLLLQTPASGNAGLFTTLMQGTGTPNASAVSSNDVGSWTLQNPTAGGATGWTKTNVAANLARNTTFTINAANQNIQLVYYDISNAATSPIVATAGVGSTGANNVASITGQPSITPTGTNQLTIDYMELGNGPSTGVFNVSGAVYDLPTHQTWKGTASISGTSLTTSATTWGTFQGASSVISGVGVAAGTSYESGAASPWTINPSQTVSSETMTQSNTDSEEMSWGNAAGHYFNGSNVSAQSWGYTFANHSVALGQSALSFAIILAGPPAAVGSTPLRPLLGVGQ